MIELNKILESAGSQAILLTGPAWSGKRTALFELARQYLSSERLESHPDYIFITTLETGVAELRERLSALSLSSYKGAGKVVLIPDIQNLSDASYATLLKTIEEPRSKALFLMSASNTDRIPETVLSRCMLFRMNVNSGLGVELPADLGKEDAELIRTIAGNSSELAQALLAAGIDWVKKTHKSLSGLESLGVAERFELISHVTAEAAPLWLMILINLYKQLPRNTKRLRLLVSANKLYHALPNINLKLSLEALVLEV